MLRPDALRSADYVVFDTTFPRHLATLGTPYLQSLRVPFRARAVIPRAVEMELRQAATLGYASSVQALIGPQGVLKTIRLDSDQVVRAQRLREDLPVKTGGSSENLGEAEAIILVKDLAADGASALVIDDRDGALAAMGRGINTLGSVWVLGFAAVSGVYSDDDAWDIYARLVAGGMGIPAEGWQPDPAGEANFHTALAQWRASMAVRA